MAPRSPMSRPHGRQRQFRLPSLTCLLHTFDYGQPCKSEATPTPPHSARYLEARFETIAVVGHLSQSNWPGRAFGHTKSRRLFSLLGGAERRAGIVVLPPRSTFPKFEKSKSEARLKVTGCTPEVFPVSRFRKGLPTELSIHEGNVVRTTCRFAIFGNSFIVGSSNCGRVRRRPYLVFY